MILVVENATDLQPIPQEPRRCSLEQALRNMGWPCPEATAAKHAVTPARRPLPLKPRLQVVPAPAPVRPVAVPLPQLQPMPQAAIAVAG
ncbi:hypothetical protein [Arenimonas composti]|uniref:Uncharacterized protein n=1 Tax=Arenimonas composti TR7-09 = DSM 18010 TaxID=1121013 RepID=A0A091C3Z8_9GAMM|nr:hypothetical protein [Arenimonas composti]KFN51375.1 hypothetical protein P873_03660 [Arenimonas composti TR7-09 = DSM 18010]